MIFFFFVLALVSLLILTLTVGTRIEKIRSGQEYIRHPESLSSLLAPKIDALAVLLVLVAGNSLRWLSHKIIIYSHRLLSILKELVIKVEGKFAGVVDTIHGRGQIDKKSSTSFFLREIGDKK